jgi:hypothetical protein
MDPTEIQNLADLESVYWWYSLRPESVIKYSRTLTSGSKILDPGSVSVGNTIFLSGMGLG